MDWRQFIASVIGSLAWPFTLIVGLYFLKDHLGSIFPFIERVKYKDLEVEFRKSLQELANQSQLAFPPPEIDEQVTTPKNRLYTLAEISPRAAILEAWLQVESAAAEAIQTREPSLGKKLSAVAPLRLAEYLDRYRIINPAQAKIFTRLRDLRNKAVHMNEATFHLDEITEYIDLALSLASQIRKGTQPPEQP